MGGATAARNPDRPTNVITGPVRQDGGVIKESKPITRMTSPEKWEIKQVCAEGRGSERRGEDRREGRGGMRGRCMSRRGSGMRGRCMSRRGSGGKME